MEHGFELIGDKLIIRLSNDLDHHNAAEIAKVSDHYIYQNPIKAVIFDFTNTSFMDSSGIGVIMGRYKLMETFGGTVSIVHINKTVDRIFTMSGLYKIISKYSTLEQAMDQ